MDRSKISEAIREIREYTASHETLQRAHHFMYDLPFDTNEASAEILWLGINPGESKNDVKTDAVRGPLEETRDSDYRDGNWTGPRKAWRTNCRKIVGERPTVSSNLFFWSSRDLKHLEERYGCPMLLSPHLPSCIKWLNVLLEEYRPKAVIVAGMKWKDVFKDHFKLGEESPVSPDGDAKPLLWHFKRTTPWFIVPHPRTGLSNIRKREIKIYIDEMIAERN